MKRVSINQLIDLHINAKADKITNGEININICNIAQ